MNCLYFFIICIVNAQMKATLEKLYAFSRLHALMHNPNTKKPVIIHHGHMYGYEGRMRLRKTSTYFESTAFQQTIERFGKTEPTARARAHAIHTLGKARLRE